MPLHDECCLDSDQTCRRPPGDGNEGPWLVQRGSGEVCISHDNHVNKYNLTVKYEKIGRKKINALPRNRTRVARMGNLHDTTTLAVLSDQQKHTHILTWLQRSTNLNVQLRSDKLPSCWLVEQVGESQCDTLTDSRCTTLEQATYQSSNGARLRRHFCVVQSCVYGRVEGEPAFK